MTNGHPAVLSLHGGGHARAEQGTKGQTVEIRCELKKEGDFREYALYHPLFPVRGEGTLKMDNGITFLPNDRYLLENEKFRLYYTAAG